MFDKIVKVWDGLTLTKVLLGIFAGVSGISLYTIWEQRNAVFITLTGSIFAMSSMAAGIGLLFVAGVCWLFVAALDRKTDITVHTLNGQITDLRHMLDEQRKDMDRMRLDFDRAIEREQRECRERLTEMTRTFTEMLNRPKL